MQVLDALHIYNVADVVDKAQLSEAQIFWTDDGLKAALLINNYCHALLDFSNNEGYCRNGFPEPNGELTQVKERMLTNEIINKIFAGV